MSKYYLHNGSENIGPFNLEELEIKQITTSTQVWCEGLEDWKNAGDVEELKCILQVQPPPFKKVVILPPILKTSIQENKNEITAETKNRSWSKIIAKSIVLIILIVMAFGIIASYSSNNNNTPSYEESLMTIAEIEASAPIDYLNADGKYYKTFLGDQIKIDGQIQNKATVITYKDVIIEVVFYSKTNSEVGREQYTIYDFFAPNSKKDFKLKVKNYSNVETIGWDVSGALIK